MLVTTTSLQALATDNIGQFAQNGALVATLTDGGSAGTWYMTYNVEFFIYLLDSSPKCPSLSNSHIKRPMGYYAYFVAHNSRTSTCDPITEALNWVAWIETNTQVWNSFFSILLSILIVMLYLHMSGVNLCNAEGLCCVALPSFEKNDGWYWHNHM